MKPLSFFLLFAAVLLSSCSLEGKSENTPLLVGPTRYAFVNPTDSTHGDTLWVRGYNADSAAYVLDTISLSDSVCFSVQMGSYANNLVAFDATYNSEAILLQIPLDSTLLRGITSTQQDANRGHVAFRTGYNYCSLVLGYRPLRSGTQILRFTVTSDSEFPTRTYSIIQPVR